MKVAAGDAPYPTVVSLVSDMETRRDISEGLAMARILELDMALVKAELAMIKKFSMQLLLFRVFGCLCNVRVWRSGHGCLLAHVGFISKGVSCTMFFGRQQRCDVLFFCPVRG